MIDLDDIDNIILREITKDGRITNVELSQRVGLSPSACLRRVQEMESTGLIKGYRAVIDPKKAGIGVVTYMLVGLSVHTKKAQKAFELAMSKSDEVRECHNVTGSFEYILRVETRDLAAFKSFHTDVLGVFPQLSSISTHVVMESSKDVRA